MRVTFLIDGFNLYHSILELEKDSNHKTRWLNLDTFLKSLLPNIHKDAKCESIFFFTAIRFHLQNKNPETIKRHLKYIKIIKSFGINIERGKFKEKYVHCHECGKYSKKHEEKETDVAIATKMIDIAVNKKTDIIALVTGDTDLIPAIKFVKQNSPNIKIYSVFPYARKNEEFKKHVDGTIKLNADKYLAHQLPNPVTVQGDIISKPSHW